jgi:hypothetical protein
MSGDGGPWAVDGGRVGTKDRAGTSGGGPNPGGRELPGVKAALVATRNPEKRGSALWNPAGVGSNCAVNQGGETGAASAGAGSRSGKAW